MGMGWLNGMASQVSLPNIYFTACWIAASNTRGVTAAEGLAACRRVPGRREPAVGHAASSAPPAALRRWRPRPAKSAAGSASTSKRMSEKPAPLNCALKPWIGAGLVGQQVEPVDHAGHGVDLAAELRHEEAVHDRWPR